MFTEELTSIDERLRTGKKAEACRWTLGIAMLPLASTGGGEK